MKEVVLHAFRERFREAPQWLVRAPGRLNLIGDHTDYNDGFVLPMAIDRAVWIALRPRSGDSVTLHSLDFNESFRLEFEKPRKDAITWKEYVKGVAWSLQDAGLELAGWEGVVAGDVPIGSGLSSSAAFELAVARAFAVAADWVWQPERVAQWMQKAENEWVGVSSGIMDPLISAVAQPGKATLIDCRSLETRQVAIPEGVAVVIMNTMKPRGLVDSAYNERRRQCELAARSLGVRSLRDVRMVDLLGAQASLAEKTFKRARHVLFENQRVVQMAESLEQDNPVAAGELMKLSHLSLRDDFEVSCRELDEIVEAAIRQPGCFGARMTGAGFGGCAVGLVQEDSVAGLIKMVSREYRQRVGIEPQIFVSAPAGGAELVKLD
jgi:galactokinase